MFQSKSLKSFEEKKNSKLHLWWIESDLSRYYYDFIFKFFQNPYFQIKRLIQWYLNVFRYDHDFDGHCLFAIIEYKLKRLERVLLNGHAIQNPKDMHALRLAIKLAGRLKEDKYEDRAHDRLDRKWGKYRNKFPLKRTKVNKENEKQYSKDFMKENALAENRRKREEHLMYAILEKYLRYWWD